MGDGIVVSGVRVGVERPGATRRYVRRGDGGSSVALNCGEFVDERGARPGRRIPTGEAPQTG